MKKLLFSVFILIAAVTTNAQNLNGELFIGINGTQVDGDGLKGYYKPGIMAGMGTYFEIKEDLTFHFSGLFNQKGAQTKMDKYTNDQFKQRLNYIDFPLYLEYKVWQELRLSTGFTPGVLISAKSITNGWENNNTDDMNRFSLDWMFSAKYDVADNLGLGVRFSYSTLTVRKDGAWRNNLLSFFTSFYF